MLLMQALLVRVVCENLDNPAFRHVAVPAGVHHARKLGLQSVQTSDAAAHRSKVLARDQIRVGARTVRIVGQLEQCSHVI